MGDPSDSLQRRFRMTSPFSLHGRVALVTGASRGLGFAMAQGLAQAGATVVLNGRDPATLEARRAEIDAAGGKAAVAAFDVRERAAADTAIDAITSRFGALDILVNNAAFGVPRDFFDITDDDWRVSMDVALDACFRLSRKAAAGMVHRGWGRVVMISSVNARIGLGTNTAYITAKAGREGLTRGLAAEEATRGVTVNCIAPGAFPTDAEKIHPDPEGYTQFVLENQAIKRRGTPADMANAVLFFASDLSAFVTGQSLLVDGGWVMR